jgi:HD-GYP domain-containing protein (c-di-GMP phosphodiesterase class II)
MVMRDRIIGVLEGVNKKNGDFVEQDRDILSVIASHAATAINNARLLRDAEQRARNLQALQNINDAVLNNLDLQLTLPQILLHVQDRLSVDATDILLLNKKTQRLVFAAERGFRTNLLKKLSLKIGEGNAGRVALNRKMVGIPDLRTAGDATVIRVKHFQGEDFVAYYAAPLIVKGGVLGVLEVFHRDVLDVDNDWLAFFQVIADQTALAIDRATLFGELQISNADLRLAYDATIEGWSHALDLRDRETEGHSQRVTEMTIQLARAFRISDDELIHIRRGALLHDMGKIAVPDSVLFKPDTLSDEEWIQMRMHPQYAFEMLEPIEYLKPALVIPYCHHEKWDGSGYPRGLKGEEIPLAARLFAIVDVWDALRNDRPYRKGWPKDVTISFLREQAGKHFDPVVVDVFIKLIQDVP